MISVLILLLLLSVGCWAWRDICELTENKTECLKVQNCKCIWCKGKCGTFEVSLPIAKEEYTGICVWNVTACERKYSNEVYMAKIRGCVITATMWAVLRICIWIGSILLLGVMALLTILNGKRRQKMLARLTRQARKNATDMQMTDTSLAKKMDEDIEQDTEQIDDEDYVCICFRWLNIFVSFLIRVANSHWKTVGFVELVSIMLLAFLTYQELWRMIYAQDICIAVVPSP